MNRELAIKLYSAAASRFAAWLRRSLAKTGFAGNQSVNRRPASADF
jgi:hypothetical protein